MATQIGVDVSHWDVDRRGGPIDWNAVKAAGYTFAFVKASDGSSSQDAEFGANVKGALAAGLAVGAFHFLRPESDAASQAANFLNHITAIGGMGLINFGLAVDVEDPDDAPGSWGTISQQDRAEKVLNWMAAVKVQASAPPYIYCIPNWFAQNVSTDPTFATYPLWMAAPSGQPSLSGTSWSDYAIWQDSQNATVDGIGSNSVDTDRTKPS